MLKKLNDQLAEVRRQQSAIASKLGDIAAECHDIETEATDNAAGIAAAEQNLIEHLARQELGEKSDTASAEKALADAKTQAANGIETSTRLRVLDAVKTRFEGEHKALHEKGVAIIAAIREAEKDRLVEIANELFNDCETALESLAQAEPKLYAARSLLNEYGHPWHLGQLVQAQVQARFPTSPNQARAAVLAELNHA
ncbi:hypothetical protein [Thiobacillus denitrificans]|uniref:Uncharacterized protein n=1 Tax=Thiobacillus denitrificans TaxID=36861 RepID=A0A125BC37_THIDE|nr:hypothetical protein [Thiobacillus denitrificans]KVW94307.1 hypothetical protein ABW22_13045 [Thiobacillus denitrificans]